VRDVENMTAMIDEAIPDEYDMSPYSEVEVA